MVEAHYAPKRRTVAGVWQPDMSFPGANEAEARDWAEQQLRAEGLDRAYRFVRFTGVPAHV